MYHVTSLSVRSKVVHDYGVPFIGQIHTGKKWKVNTRKNDMKVKYLYDKDTGKKTHENENYLTWRVSGLIL